MTPTLLIDLISEQRFLILNLCTFLGRPVEDGNRLAVSIQFRQLRYISHQVVFHFNPSHDF